MKFAFVHAEKAHFPVMALCRLLGVSRQGYYAYASRGPSRRVRSEGVLHGHLRRLHDESGGRYGSPRLLRALRAEGVRVGKTRVERAMRALGLEGVSPRRFRCTTRRNPAHHAAENLLGRDFTAKAPNERWATDITYVWTDEGWCYLAVILDLFSRAVVGWALDATVSTDLPLAALRAALVRRRPPRGLLHHSDRGCQYTSDRYRQELEGAGITASMSRVGNCWDNAVAESFFATLKTELVERHRWTGRLALRAALFDYIEVFYNRRRLHSSIAYKTPAQVEAEHRLNHAA
jgi:transposase InsO family protein